MAELVCTQRLSKLPPNTSIFGQLSLTAHQRSQTRHRFPWPEQDGELVLQLPRGTVLQPGDLLQATSGQVIEVCAQPESVLTVTAADPHLLLRAAYHLGNRHVPLEVQPQYLRLGYDSVLETMLAQLGVEVCAETAPLQPERGAYHAHA